MPYNLLKVFRNKLNDAYLNLNALYEFECEKTVVTNFKDFVLPKFNLKLELPHQTVSGDVKKKKFVSTDTVLI